MDEDRIQDVSFTAVYAWIVCDWFYLCRVPSISLAMLLGRKRSERGPTQQIREIVPGTSALQQLNGVQRRGKTRLKPRNISKTKTTV